VAVAVAAEAVVVVVVVVVAVVVVVVVPVALVHPVSTAGRNAARSPCPSSGPPLPIRH
jgi:hypothetical protein